MISRIRAHWPLTLAVLILWASVALLLTISLRQNAGHLVYALDDPYIHMAIAKNLVQHGIWGVTPYGFSSSSSSLLWPLILAAVYLVSGPNAITPLLVNILCATLSLYVVYRELRRRGGGPRFVAIVLIAMTMLTSLPALIFTGMEHTLHTLLTLMVLVQASRVLEVPPSLPIVRRALFLLVPLLTATRYEGLLLIAPICVLLLVRQRPVFAVQLGVLAILPPLIYGVVAVAHGWSWLPASVLLKANTFKVNIFDLDSPSSPRRFLTSTLRLFSNLHLLCLSLAALMLVFQRWRKGVSIWDSSQTLVIIYLAMTLLHLQFAQVGWFFRYEAYLVAAGLFVVAAAACEEIPRGHISLGMLRTYFADLLPLKILVLVLALALLRRGWTATTSVPQATTNIYDQQYQMAVFLERFYGGAAVAANDVGAINYLAEIRCLDLWGLGSVEVFSARMAGTYSPATVAELAQAKGVEVALIYDTWFETERRSYIPTTWIKVGTWQIQNNVVTGSDTVSLYAADPASAERLATHLREFQNVLPPTVIQRGLYIQ